jgi:hypothetical protein
MVFRNRTASLSAAAWLYLIGIAGAQQSAGDFSAQPRAYASEQSDTPSVYQRGGQPMAGQPQTQSPYRLAERSLPVLDQPRPRISPPPQRPNEHPLIAALQWAEAGKQEIEKIHDYKAILVKRERHDGKLGDYEYIFMKFRQKPLSVYMYFLGPPQERGQEVIYFPQRDGGRMWAHGVGVRKMFGTVSLNPDGPVAMKGNHYPIYKLGLMNLVDQLIEVGQHDAKYGECEVKFIPGTKVNERVCTCLEVMHPRPRRTFLFHKARIFVDDELGVPVRYEAYYWPREPEGRPELIEEYTYLNLELNNGFTDADFDLHNPKYGFKSR